MGILHIYVKKRVTDWYRVGVPGVMLTVEPLHFRTIIFLHVCMRMAREVDIKVDSTYLSLKWHAANEKLTGLWHKEKDEMDDCMNSTRIYVYVVIWLEIPMSSAKTNNRYAINRKMHARLLEWLLIKMLAKFQNQSPTFLLCNTGKCGMLVK